jgi:nucleoside-diphosphate-sugar epimerase
MISGEKILVTGVHGAVAFPLARSLVSENDVWGAARFTDPTLRAKVDDAGITTCAIDLAAGDFEALPDDFTYILHLAYFRGGDDQFGESFRINAEGTGLVLQHCRRANAALVVSSHVVYTPTDDPWHAHHEDEPVGGMRAPWAATAPSAKVAEESVARFCARAFDLPVTITRLNTVYGPDPRYLPTMNGVAVANGAPVGVRGDPCPHSPIHVDDMAWQMEALLDAARSPATIVNWCGDTPVTAHHWCELAADATGTRPEIVVRTVAGAPCQNVGDPTRRAEITGPCRVEFDDAFLRSLAAVRPDPNSQVSEEER